jgi:hypothetical protein
MTAMDSGYRDTANFNTAWNHPDQKFEDYWQDVFCRAFKDLHDKSVWIYTSRHSFPTTLAIPTDRKCLGLNGCSY